MTRKLEQAAEAIWPAIRSQNPHWSRLKWGVHVRPGSLQWETALGAARSAIEAMRCPTYEMTTAAVEEMDDNHPHHRQIDGDQCQRIYDAMLDKILKGNEG